MSNALLKVGASDPKGTASALAVDQYGALSIRSGDANTYTIGKILEPIAEGFVGVRAVLGVKAYSVNSIRDKLGVVDSKGVSVSLDGTIYARHGVMLFGFKVNGAKFLEKELAVTVTGIRATNDGVFVTYGTKVAFYDTKGTLKWETEITQSKSSGAGYVIKSDNKGGAIICVCSSVSSRPNQVTRITPAGTIVWQVQTGNVAVNSGAGFLAYDSVTVGNVVYVATGSSGDVIMVKLDLETGAVLGTVSNVGYGRVTSIDIGADGLLILANSGKTQLLKINRTTNAVTTVNYTKNIQRALAMLDGYVLVLAAGGEIHKVDNNFSPILTLASLGSLTDDNTYALGADCNDYGHIYIATDSMLYDLSDELTITGYRVTS